MKLNPGISLMVVKTHKKEAQLQIFKVKFIFSEDKQEELVTSAQRYHHYLSAYTHHDSDLPLVDVQVWDVVDVHPFESAADAAVRARQKNHREASWKRREEKQGLMR